MHIALAYTILILLNVLLAAIGWELCFEDTYLGGWMPFIAIILGPTMGFGIGIYLRHVTEEPTSTDLTRARG